MSEMKAKSVLPLKKEIKDNPTRQGMQEERGPPQKKTGKQGKKERVLFLKEHNRQVFPVKIYMHLILNSSTGTLVTVAISTAPDGEFHSESTRSQAKPAHIPHHMLREIKLQVARRHQGGHPHSAPECVN